MSWKERIIKKKRDLQAQYHRGIEVTAQMKAEKMRHKMERRKYMEPGTIRYGLATKQNPLDLMKDVKTRRVEKRKLKQEQQKKQR